MSDDEVRHNPFAMTPASAHVSALHHEMLHEDPSMWLHCARLTRSLDSRVM